MTLPASGVITMNEIATEFGGAAPYSLSNYYRGGANVPNTASTASIPTSGVISLNNFYGTSKGIILTLTAGTLFVTPGNNTFWGYTNPNELNPPSVAPANNIGAMSPNIINAATIFEFTQILPSGSSTYNFGLVIEGTLTQSFFNAISFIDRSSIHQTLTSASASFSLGGAAYASSFWSWFGQTTQFFNAGTNYAISIS